MPALDTLQIVYCVFFALAIFAAMMVVLSPHAVHGAMFLVMTMVAIAALFILLNAQLAAAFQIIVYAGAIMVLFIFVIMLLNLGRMPHPSPRLAGVRGIGLLFGAAFIGQMIWIVGKANAQAEGTMPATLQNHSIQTVARLLLTKYIYAFEMTSILLLVAVVGAVILAKRHVAQHLGEVESQGPAEKLP